MILLSCPLHGRTGHEAAWALLAEGYRRETGEELPQVARTDRGKPYFPHSSWHFSLSHTSRHAFCVLAKEPVGIDAEELDRPIRLELAERILSPEEYRQFSQAEDQRRALLTFWVLKEAAAKCTGEGLRGYPNHTLFSLKDPRVTVKDGCLVAIVTGCEDSRYKAVDSFAQNTP